MNFKLGAIIGVLGIFLSPLVEASALEDIRVQASVVKRIKEKGKADLLIVLKDQADLSPALKIKDRSKRISYVYKTLTTLAEKSQANLVQSLGKKAVRSFYINNSILVKNGDEKLIQTVLSFPEVAQVFLDQEGSLKLPTVKAPLVSEDEDIPESIKLINADKVWNELGVKGMGIVIAGQDGGYHWTHEALRGKYRGTTGLGVNHNYNWHDAIHTKGGRCGPDTKQPCDDTGHGTHTMGNMVGDDGKGNRIGVAPDAKWIGCRNMKDGAGTASTYLECFEFFLAPFPIGGNPKTDGKPELAPHIVNNSWACPSSEGCTGGEFVGATKALKAAGIMVVAAAGNEGPGCGSIGDPPGTYSDDVFVVGAYDRYNKGIASFSSRGPSRFTGAVGLDLVAPGTAIRSSVIGDREYDHKSGTSMASPHAAGAIALLWSARPQLIGQIDETTEILRKTAKKITSTQSCGKFPGMIIPNVTFGYGMMDIYGAIQAVAP